MKGILIALLAVVLAGLAVHAANEQADGKPCALGFCMGQSIEDKPDGDAHGISYNEYDHRAFNGGVTVYWTETTGVCGVKGFHRVAGADNRGEAHNLAFNRYVELVTRKYGEPDNEFDFVSAGSLWDEPRHWLRGLRSGERSLVSFWVESLPEGILAIKVEANATFIVVGYQFSNDSECREVGKQSIGSDF